jgi:glycosyltransferase involved in cell wall biosynthesis
MAMNLSTTICAVSRGVATQVAGSLRGKTIILENGVRKEDLDSSKSSGDVEKMLTARGISLKGPFVVVVANFGSWSDPTTVVRAAQYLKGRLSILLVGDGPSLRDARAERDRLALGNVHLLGRVPHDEALVLVCASMACVCPYNANWPNSRIPQWFSVRKVKEYLAAGKPILVPDVPAREAVLVDGVTALVYPAGDGRGLSAKMLELLDQPDLAARISRNALKAADDFTWSSVLRRSGLLDILSHKSAPKQ